MFAKNYDDIAGKNGNHPVTLTSDQEYHGTHGDWIYPEEKFRFEIKKLKNLMGNIN
jgi:hypothetical protein